MKLNLLSAVAIFCLTACAGDLTDPRTSLSSAASQSDTATPATEPAYVNTLPLERLFQSPSLSGSTPRALAFSPDGSKVTFLKPR
ncbi:MAG: hypothetical protein AAF583_14685, partial [Pseudomonadota bacterium]